MIGEKIKYNTPLPGVEFRSRDLALPAEAAKVLYEIDFQYGQDKELCLSILSNTFRTYPEVTQILQEAARNLQRGVQVSEWHHKAVMARNARVAVLERNIALSEDKARRTEKELDLATEEEWRTRQILERSPQVSSVETPFRNLSSEFEDQTPISPATTTTNTTATSSTSSTITTPTPTTQLTSSNNHREQAKETHRMAMARLETVTSRRAMQEEDFFGIGGETIFLQVRSQK